MELTQAQISEIVYEKASSEQGLHELITLLLNSLLKHERSLWQEENKEAANGFRARCVRYHVMEFALQSHVHDKGASTRRSGINL